MFSQCCFVFVGFYCLWVVLCYVTILLVRSILLMINLCRVTWLTTFSRVSPANHIFSFLWIVHSADYFGYSMIWFVYAGRYIRSRGGKNSFRLYICDLVVLLWKTLSVMVVYLSYFTIAPSYKIYISFKVKNTKFIERITILALEIIGVDNLVF